MQLLWAKIVGQVGIFQTSYTSLASCGSGDSSILFSATWLFLAYCYFTLLSPVSFQCRQSPDSREEIVFKVIFLLPPAKPRISHLGWHFKVAFCVVSGATVATLSSQILFPRRHHKSISQTLLRIINGRQAKSQTTRRDPLDPFQCQKGRRR